MSQPPLIWSEAYPVRAYDVDARGQLGIASVCNFLQDAAGCHAHALGLSVEQLHTWHLTWVLVRMRLEVARHLAWRDCLHIETWPSHRDRLFSQRDFILYDDAETIVGRCVTVWVLMDLQRWRPRRLSDLPNPLPIPDRPRALSRIPDKIAAVDVGKSDTQAPFRVGDRDLDRNGHVNNVRYIEWAIETVPVNILNTCRLEILEINFTGEAFHNESIIAESISREAAQPCFHHTVRSQTTGTHLARAQTHWRMMN
jgi:acyl-ACP thioesterase